MKESEPPVKMRRLFSTFLGPNPDKQKVRPLRDCLVSTNFAQDCLVTKNLALSLRRPSDQHCSTQYKRLKFLDTISVARLAVVSVLLRFCALGSGVGFCGNTVLAMRPYFRGGPNPIFAWENTISGDIEFSWGPKPNYPGGVLNVVIASKV